MFLFPPQYGVEAWISKIRTPPMSDKSAIKIVFKGIKNNVLHLHSFTNEVKNKKLSGELVIHTDEQRISVLFIEGIATIDSQGIGVNNALDLIETSGVTMDFFDLGVQLATAYLSTMAGKRAWSSTSASQDNLKKVLIIAKKKQLTGHLDIHTDNGPINQLFIHNGKTLGVFNTKNDWLKLPPQLASKNGLKMELFVCSNPTNQPGQTRVTPKRSEPVTRVESLLPRDLERFLQFWNEFTMEVADKVGENLVAKSLEKNFGKLDIVFIRGIKLKNTVAPEDVVSYDLESLRLPVHHFLQAMIDISGKRWIHDRLLYCAQDDPKIFKILNLANIFPV